LQTPTRRNDPCPCGSGLRFKECHGRLEGSSEPGVDTLVGRALQLHREGRLDEAARAYSAILERAPGHPVATHYLGMVAWVKGDRIEAERLLRASIEADARVPDFHSNLAMLLRDTGRHDEAIAGYRRALSVDPGWFEAHNNLALALEDLRRFDEAEAEYRKALEREPRYAAAQQNLARLLLAKGRFAEAWDRYRWRLLAQGDSQALPAADAPRLPAALGGRRFVLVAEQGLGDVLFFLRFAPELASRGAQLAFRGDARLHAMLERTGHFALGCAGANAPAAGLEAVAIGDLPWLLGANDAASLPPPLALRARDDRLEAMRARLPTRAHPLLAITWRSGVTTAGPSRTQLKEVPIAALGQALRGLPATWMSVQRLPRPGEREALEQALDAPVADFSAVNDDLEDALAILSLIDGYVGTSNANMHLAAGLGLASHVLVPDPPEWRWLAEGARSPWFPRARVYRPRAGAWSEAFAELRTGLGSDPEL
jgi:Flp pilus assembly protein TadD